jgi:hypothetical protein
MGSGVMFFALDFDGEVRDALRSFADVMCCSQPCSRSCIRYSRVTLGGRAKSDTNGLSYQVRMIGDLNSKHNLLPKKTTVLISHSCCDWPDSFDHGQLIQMAPRISRLDRSMEEIHIIKHQPEAWTFFLHGSMGTGK